MPPKCEGSNVASDCNFALIFATIDPTSDNVHPGHTAIPNHEDRLRSMVESMCSLLDGTPAYNCSAIMRTQAEQMSALVDMAQKAAGADPIASAANFPKKGDTNIRRHKSYLERTHKASEPQSIRTSSQLAGSNILQRNCLAPRQAQGLHSDSEHACTHSVAPFHIVLTLFESSR
jgi:hypothetical protein